MTASRISPLQRRVLKHFALVFHCACIGICPSQASYLSKVDQVWNLCPTWRLLLWYWAFMVTARTPDIGRPVALPAADMCSENLADRSREQPNCDGTERQTTTIIEEGPDGGYGWVCVVCMLLLTAHTWGLNGVSARLDSESKYHQGNVMTVSRLLVFT